MTLVGTESKALGIHVQLGPVAGPLGKIPTVSRMIIFSREMLKGMRPVVIGKGSLLIPISQELQWQM